MPEHLFEAEPLAEAVLALSERLDGLYDEDEAKHALMNEDDNELAEVDEDEELTEEEVDEAKSEDEPAGPPEAILSLLRELSKVALELASALEEDEDVAKTFAV